VCAENVIRIDLVKDLLNSAAMVAPLRFFLSRCQSWAEAEGLLEAPRGRTELRTFVAAATCSSAMCATPPGGATHGRSDQKTNFPEMPLRLMRPLTTDAAGASAVAVGAAGATAHRPK
jgi:hypothetical protein